MNTIIKECMNDQAYALLHDKIIKQELVSGQQINLRQIASEYKVSIMPIRDALMRLVNKGLVVNKPRVGYFVRSFSKREIEEIMETRVMFETYYLEKYFDNLDKPTLEQVLQSHENHDKTTLPRETFDRFDTILHDCIIDAATNQFIKEKYNNLLSVFFLFRYLNLERYSQAYDEHKRLIRTILRGERRKSVEILTDHINGATSMILSNLK